MQVAEWRERTAGWLPSRGALKRERAPSAAGELPAAAPRRHAAAPEHAASVKAEELPADGEAALVAANAPPEFTGALQTYHESKGWEHVAHVRTSKWPPHVPQPECAFTRLPHACVLATCKGLSVLTDARPQEREASGTLPRSPVCCAACDRGV